VIRLEVATGGRPVDALVKAMRAVPFGRGELARETELLARLDEVEDEPWSSVAAAVHRVRRFQGWE
jgi:hypothetical protein